MGLKGQGGYPPSPQPTATQSTVNQYQLDTSIQITWCSSHDAWPPNLCPVEPGFPGSDGSSVDIHHDMDQLHVFMVAGKQLAVRKGKFPSTVGGVYVMIKDTGGVGGGTDPEPAQDVPAVLTALVMPLIPPMTSVPCDCMSCVDCAYKQYAPGCGTLTDHGALARLVK